MQALQQGQGEAEDRDEVKATLTFAFPEERIEHLSAVHGLDVVGILHRVADHLRSRLKYADGDLGDAQTELESVRELLAEELADLPIELRQ